MWGRQRARILHSFGQTGCRRSVPLRQETDALSHIKASLPMLSVLRRSLSSPTVSAACSRATAAMADALAKVPDVEIDPEGTFKYILVKVKVKDGEANKDIVRGTKSAQYHNHIFEKVSPAMEALGMECKCLGGGKIEHNSQEKKLRVFGESTAFGKADHSLSAEKLKSAFSGYEVTWSDDTK